MKQLCFFLFLIWAIPSQAEWIRYESTIRNPWFVQNTGKVFYCIVHAPDDFSADFEQVRSSVRESLNYVASEVAKTNTKESLLALGQQEFIETSCDDNRQDLAFYFGASSLSYRQLIYLSPLSSVAATTVRTDYDKEFLRAKGFVFLNSDRGNKAHKLLKSTAWGGWKHPQLLRIALAEEVAKIFGLQSSVWGNRSVRALEGLLENQKAAGLTENPLVNVDNDFETCSLTKQERQLFGLSNSSCLKTIGVWKDDRIDLVEKDVRKGVKLLGSIRIKKDKLLSWKQASVVMLELPSEQKVFSAEQVGGKSFLEVSSIQERFTAAQLVLGKKLRPIYLRVTQQSFEMLSLEPKGLGLLFRYQTPLAKILSEDASQLILEPASRTERLLKAEAYIRERTPQQDSPVQLEKTE